MFSSVTTFSALVAASALAAVVAFRVLASRQRIDSRAVDWFSVLSIPFGVFFGHLLFAVSMARLYISQPEYGLGFWLRPWDGGFMFYGAVLGCVLSALITRRITGVRVMTVLDAASVALLLLIALIRLSEPFDNLSDVGQGYGLSVYDLPMPPFLPFAFSPYSDMPDELCMAVFALEAIYALVIAVLSVRWLGRLPKGQTALRALLLYAAAQILFETLRRDYTVRLRFVRVSQLISALVLLGLMIYACRSRRLSAKETALRIAALLVLAGGVVALEFAVDKPLILPNGEAIFFEYWVTYSLIGLCAAAMGIVTWRSLCPAGKKEPRAKAA